MLRLLPMLISFVVFALLVAGVLVVHSVMQSIL